MEDGAILGGAMLSLLCDRFAVTNEESLRGEGGRRFCRAAALRHGAWRARIRAGSQQRPKNVCLAYGFTSRLSPAAMAGLKP